MPSATAKYRPWTTAETDALRARYGKDDARDISRDLGRSVIAVFKRANAIGLRSMRFWTPEEDLYIRPEVADRLAAIPKWTKTRAPRPRWIVRQEAIAA